LTCASVIVKCSSKPPQLRQLQQLKQLLLLAVGWPEVEREVEG
jgi:hypothetical protein